MRETQKAKLARLEAENEALLVKVAELEAQQEGQGHYGDTNHNTYLAHFMWASQEK